MTQRDKNNYLKFRTALKQEARKKVTPDKVCGGCVGVIDNCYTISLFLENDTCPFFIIHLN